MQRHSTLHQTTWTRRILGGKDPLATLQRNWADFKSLHGRLLATMGATDGLGPQTGDRSSHTRNAITCRQDSARRGAPID